MYMYMSFVSFDVFITSTEVQAVCNLSVSILVRGRGRKRGEREWGREREGGRERESREIKSHFAISLCCLWKGSASILIARCVPLYIHKHLANPLPRSAHLYGSLRIPLPLPLEALIPPPPLPLHYEYTLTVSQIHYIVHNIIVLVLYIVSVWQWYGICTIHVWR